MAVVKMVLRVMVITSSFNVDDCFYQEDDYDDDHADIQTEDKASNYFNQWRQETSN